ncbi:Ribose 5-phosphate isomerase [Pedobacter sp. BAL39]|uniref:ribose 5-phosphate isomerase A n=1 Tax=Pedobacter sp. BAL39 TaxID=391596 RepID=UPI00015595D3|nr:ribose 5-phosphate isomerase A [Pedobacter sp. BAL39]EDM37675.1 Ribose 5-phosphate isomerase [Pedobacter sp. BAL39]
MNNYKQQAATEAFKLISKGQVIGLGAGSTIAYLVKTIAADHALASTLTFSSPSYDTVIMLNDHRLNVKPSDFLQGVDLYFDGCDQLDWQLNALKSGGGIHTYEKILAVMADEFVLLGDYGKLVEHLDVTYPLVIEVLPQALNVVSAILRKQFKGISLIIRTGDQRVGPVRTDGGCYLIDASFVTLPGLELLDQIKMIPGVVDHSLFFKLADKAILAGPEGIRTITQK